MNTSSISYEHLKAKHRAVRDKHPNDLTLRIHRALSWLQRAEIAKHCEPRDPDAVFIFHWIAFNAAYAEDADSLQPQFGERSAFEAYFRKIINLDADNVIYDAIWQKFSGSIRVLLDNRYVFQPFWKHHNGEPGYENWESRFQSSKVRVHNALAATDTHTALTALFDRLYVLRNQLIHGGATWNSSVNRNQVIDGAAIMAFIVPALIELMMNNPQEDWGKPFYPVVD